MHAPLEYKEHFQSQAILLLRSPLTAFPSRLNHLWEQNHQVGFHTKQAPENTWNRWIKLNLDTQLHKYKSFVLAWSNSSFHYNITLYLPYEGLTDRDHGQEWTPRVGKVLQMANIRVAHPNVLECLWRYTLFEQPKRKRAHHSYVPGYTQKQHAKLLQMMDELLEETQDIAELHHILHGYRETIQTETRVLVPNQNVNTTE
jgi:hypothetical protein